MNQHSPLVIGNWKLNGGVDLLCRSVGALTGKHFKTDIVICPPNIFFREMIGFFKNSKLKIGTQNLSKYQSGSYTGETSAQMIKESGGELCLIGHSERRAMFNENNASCKIKIKRALEANLLPVLCIGESATQRDAGITKDILYRQINDTLGGVQLRGKPIVIAYEPVWAIGDGLAASADEVQKVHSYIRSVLDMLFGENVAQTTRIIYGGCVTKNNAYELLAEADIDGLLVGGASLDPNHFIQICLQADEHAKNLAVL
ncbi:MAG: triose-phosphate isomerase [Thalassotalea sp.]